MPKKQLINAILPNLYAPQVQPFFDLQDIHTQPPIIHPDVAISNN